MELPLITTVLFDLGSTLIYFDADWETTLQEAARVLHRRLLEMGFSLDGGFPQAYRSISRDNFRWRDEDLVETPAPAVLRRALAGYGYTSISDRQVKEALAALYAVSQAHWKVEEDAQPTLAALRAQGYRIGLVSNAGYDEDVQVLVDQAGLRPYLDTVVTSAACGLRKPHPRIFELALQHLRAGPAEAVMVGDFLPADILGANRLGLVSIWIDRRADLQAAQASLASIRPAHTISTLSELPGLIGRL